MADDSRPEWISQPPGVGDFITCYYPGDPKGELRPVLVLEVRVSEDFEEFSIRVAYATSKINKPHRAGVSVTVSDAGQVSVCGLAVPTRIDLDTQATIPWDEEYCGCWRGFSSPILGKLPTGLQVECAYTLAKLG